jgi:aspartate oxidase
MYFILNQYICGMWILTREKKSEWHTQEQVVAGNGVVPIYSQTTTPISHPNSKTSCTCISISAAGEWRKLLQS